MRDTTTWEIFLHGEKIKDVQFNSNISEEIVYVMLTEGSNYDEDIELRKKLTEKQIKNIIKKAYCPNCMSDGDTLDDHGMVDDKLHMWCTACNWTWLKKV